MISEGLNHC